MKDIFTLCYVLGENINYQIVRTISLTLNKQVIQECLNDLNTLENMRKENANKKIKNAQKTNKIITDQKTLLAVSCRRHNAKVRSIFLFHLFSGFISHPSLFYSSYYTMVGKTCFKIFGIF
jgi:hypothetical protein